MPACTLPRVPTRFWSISMVVAGLLAGTATPRAAHGQLNDATLKKVKRGTVHLHVKLANGNTAEGSGWFVDRGMIITNAHVLNMHGGDKRYPSRIEVTIDSGEKASRTVTAKFKGAAYEADLMLLKVDGDPAGKNGEPVDVKEKWGPLGQNFLKTGATFRYSSDGAVIYAQSDLRKAEPRFKAELVGITDLVLQSLELLSVPLPQDTLQPKERIRLQKMMLIGLPEMYVPTQADVKYQYLGVRKVDGQETAFFEIAADLRPRRGDEIQLNGRLFGTLDVLVATGEVLKGNSTMNVDYDVPGSNGLRMIGTLAINIRPVMQSAANKPAESDAKNEKSPDAAQADGSAAEKNSPLKTKAGNGGK